MWLITTILGLVLLTKKNASEDGQTSLDSETEMNLFEVLLAEAGGGIGMVWAKVGQIHVLNAVQVMSKGTCELLGFAVPQWAKEIGFGASAKPNPKWREERCVLLDRIDHDEMVFVDGKTLQDSCIKLVVDNKKYVSRMETVKGVHHCNFSTGIKVEIEGETTGSGKDKRTRHFLTEL